MKTDFEISRVQAANFVGRYGWEDFLRLIALMGQFHGTAELDLYSVSQEWIWLPEIKVIKAKGARGDLLVRLT